MPDLVAWAGDDSNRGWRRTIPASGEVTLGRKIPHSAWDCPWDQQISRLHAHLNWSEGKLRVRKDPRAVNPIFYRGKEMDEFFLNVGEQFVIGNTKFALQETEGAFPPEPTPHHEVTCSHQELQAVRFADADERIAALADLPSLIRYSPSDEELEKRVVDVLLAGIPRAQVAAVVWLNPQQRSKELVELRVHYAAGPGGRQVECQPSRRLVHSAIRLRRQSVMQSWRGNREGEFTVSTGSDWAICAPLPDEPSPGWALYVTGRLDNSLLRAGGPALEELHTGDLKFAEMVADIFGALRQVRDLQRRQTMMARFFSGPVLAALADSNQDIEEVLKPRQTEVTVLFCDLRGSCRIAEDSDHDLASICDRVSEALTIMTNQIIDKDGVIGDFHGDAAMGFWGWPLDTDHQVEQAARAALAIRKDFLRFSQRRGHPLEGFACGIGIAHGTAIAGRLGTQDQFKVSVFGPVVNLAARLESMTKVFQVPILLDEQAAAKLTAVDSLRLRLRRLANVQPYGMNRTVLVHELLPPVMEPKVLSETDRRDYEAALDALLAGQWDNATELLAPLRDGPADFLRQFMENHQGKPPSNWDGIIVLESK